MPKRARFEKYVLPHLDAGYNLARWLARNPHDADDISQEACVRALKYCGAMRPGQARAWFLAIVKRAFLDWCEKNRPAELVHDAEAALETIADPSAMDPEWAALRGAEARRLSDAVAALPLAFREVLVLREIEDLSYKEIAQIAGVPIGTVMSRLARARALLRHAPELLEVRQEPARGCE